MRMHRRRTSALSALLVATFANTFAIAANAEVRLNGAWAESDEGCKKAFVSKSGVWQFRAPRDMYGSSYIISGSRYEGPFGVCNLSSITPKDGKLLLALSCHNTISYSNQVTPIRMISSIEMTVFAMDGMQMSYKKCGE